MSATRPDRAPWRHGYQLRCRAERPWSPAGSWPAMTVVAVVLLLAVGGTATVPMAAPTGYYRYPALYGDTLVFAAEGDLWQWQIDSSAPARRLTTHLEEESHPAISPDGSTLAFTGRYEGASEVYTMPLAGGLPVRRTFEGERARVQGWAPDGRLLYSTRKFSRLPNTQLALLDLASHDVERIPLAQAAQGCFDPDGEVLFFTRFAFHGSHTKYYRGGTAQNLWRYRLGDEEALALTTSYPGTSRDPMCWEGRVYFVSDRDATLNIWSMLPDGRDLRQHTHHDGWEVKSPSLSSGRIAYQLGADLYLYDITEDATRRLPIVLSSDFDQKRERWVEEPLEHLSHAAISPDGDRLVLTIYGQVFVVPTGPGRLVEVTRRKDIRCRQAMFGPDGRHILTLSDASGEVEWWRYAADGMEEPEQLTDDGEVLRLRGTVSPDGRYLAYTDHDRQIWLHDLETGENTLIDSAPHAGLEEASWSPDSRWLVYSKDAETSFGQIHLYSVERGETRPITTDRYDSWSGRFDPKGEWLYFLSNRHFVSEVYGPWGSRQPDPYFPDQTEIYMLPLQSDLRSPFREPDELSVGSAAGTADGGARNGTGSRMGSRMGSGSGSGSEERTAIANAKPDAAPGPIAIELEAIEAHLQKVPVPPGNYSRLSVAGSRLFWMRHAGPSWGKGALVTMEIGDPDTAKTVLSPAATGYVLSSDGKRIMIREDDAFFVTDAQAGQEPDRSADRVDLTDLTFTIRPHELWKQMFIESWRLQRDYFWDPGMRGLDWNATLEKYLPLVARVTTREELSDLQAAMASELGTLHTWVYGGDHREADNPPPLGSLGAVLVRSPQEGGYRVERIYRTDPDRPDERGPLTRPGVGIAEGDVILTLNGVPTLEAPHVGALLHNQAGRDVRLQVRSPGDRTIRDVIVEPIPVRSEWDLRYDEWELTRRERVEEAGEGTIGYVHLRSMGRQDMGDWVREFYPVFNRQGLIIDARHNTGGNIDSWILGKLLRRAWMYWQPRTGEPYSNMQYAFRGHMVILVDEYTQSDGEALAEGFRRLGLGKIIGTRTWGGEVWLTSSNRLVDHGIVTAAEFGVYGPEGEWLIEGHGVEPDIVVDNLPHAAFEGEDAQLDRAIEHLRRLIEDDPRPMPEAPPYPPIPR